MVEISCFNHKMHNRLPYLLNYRVSRAGTRTWWQTRDVEPKLIQSWPIVCDSGPTSNQRWPRASCPPGRWSSRQKRDVHPIPAQWRSSPVDGGPTLNQTPDQRLRPPEYEYNPMTAAAQKCYHEGRS